MNNSAGARPWFVPIAVFVVMFGSEFLGSFVAPDSRGPIRPTCDVLCLAGVVWTVVWCARRATPRAALGYGFAAGAAYMVAELLGWAFGISASLRAEGAKPLPVSDLGAGLYLWLPILALAVGLVVGGMLAGVVWLVQTRRT